MSANAIMKKYEELKEKPPYSFKRKSKHLFFGFFYEGSLIFARYCSYDAAEDLVQKMNSAYFEGWLQRNREVNADA